MEDVRNGDLLRGPDGGPRKVRNTVSGEDQLYRFKLGGWKEDLVVTPNHILVLRRITKKANKYAGHTIQENRSRFEDVMGDIPDPSSDIWAPGAVNNTVKDRVDFMSALKSGLALLLGAERSATGRTKITNMLNGTSGIEAYPECYKVRIANGKNQRDECATYAWGNPDRKNLKGHKDYPPEFFATKEEAFEAAVAKSREIHESSEVTLRNLRQRFLDKSANGKNGEIKLDSALPNLSLVWATNRGNLRIRFNCFKDNKRANRLFAFPSLPEDPDSEEEEEEDESLLETSDWRGDVATAEMFEDVEMTAEEFAGLDRIEQNRHRMVRCPGVELPEHPVPVNPYFLGLWLGDGSRRNTGIATNHELEVREFLVSYAAELDLHLSYYGHVAYAIVANKTSTKPLPTATVWIPERPARREGRKTLYKQRLAAGWTVQPNRRPGERREWKPPAENSGAERVTRSEQSRGSAEIEDLDYSAMSLDGTSEPRSTSRPDQSGEPRARRRTSASRSANVPADVPTASIPPNAEVIDLVSSSPTKLPPPSAKREMSSSPIKSAPARRRLTYETHSGVGSMSLEELYASEAPIPEDPLSELMSDPDIAALAGPPTIPVGADEDDLDFIDVMSEVDEDERMEDVETESEGSESDDPDVTLEHDPERTPVVTRSRRIYRLVAGNRGFGDLHHNEEDLLIRGAVQAEEAERPTYNKLLRAMDDLGVRYKGPKGPAGDSKHIPDIYANNSRAVRLQVLAGLIDSDGWFEFDLNMFGFSQAEAWHSKLFWDTVRLARSLGFQVHTRRFQQWNPSRTVQSWVLKAGISGDVKEIPCLLTRKKAVERYKPQTHTFRIKEVSLESEPTAWSGFRVDKDQLYLRNDYMILHNSGFEGMFYNSVSSLNVLHVPRHFRGPPLTVPCHGRRHSSITLYQAPRSYAYGRERSIEGLDLVAFTRARFGRRPTWNCLFVFLEHFYLRFLLQM